MRYVNSADIVTIIRRTLNRVDTRLIEHGERVAYIVLKMLQAEGKRRRRDIRDICLATLLHDIGAYKTEEIDQMVQFETSNVWGHSVYGYLFLRTLSPLREWAPAILFHHANCGQLNHMQSSHRDIAQYIHIADRVEIYFRTKRLFPSNQFLDNYRDRVFDAPVVNLLEKAACEYQIYQAIADGSYLEELLAFLSQISFSNQTLRDYLHMLIYAIDFRSPYTVNHTVMTQSISKELASILALGSNQVEKTVTGALLHDLGKISIPVEILESPGRLTDAEMEIMKTHVDITEDILGHALDEEVTQIALRHHEKLDGSGYPKGLSGDQLTREQRIVAVADVASALTGVRSYKQAFEKDRVISIIEEMKQQNKLCPVVVDAFLQNYDRVMENTTKNCAPALDTYQSLNSEYEVLRRQLENF